jgi:hypothetical protein
VPRKGHGALGAGRWALGAGRWALGAGRWALEDQSPSFGHSVCGLLVILNIFTNSHLLSTKIFLSRN